MKQTVITVAAMLLFAFTASAYDKPVDFDSLPAAAKAFVTENFPGVKPLFASVEDDFIKPDYELTLENGVKLDFFHDGALKSIECASGVSRTLIPSKILKYADSRYPGATIVEYEIGRKAYEIKLDNGLELKFNKNFQLIEIDD